MAGVDLYNSGSDATTMFNAEVSENVADVMGLDVNGGFAGGDVSSPLFEKEGGDLSDKMADMGWFIQENLMAVFIVLLLLLIVLITLSGSGVVLLHSSVNWVLGLMLGAGALYVGVQLVQSRLM